MSSSSLEKKPESGEMFLDASVESPRVDYSYLSLGESIIELDVYGLIETHPDFSARYLYELWRIGEHSQIDLIGNLGVEEDIITRSMQEVVLFLFNQGYSSDEIGLFVLDTFTALLNGGKGREYNAELNKDEIMNLTGLFYDSIFPINNRRGALN